VREERRKFFIDDDDDEGKREAREEEEASEKKKSREKITLFISAVFSSFLIDFSTFLRTHTKFINFYSG
jgi:formate/nitrite transporter FocA (FNT family)